MVDNLAKNSAVVCGSSTKPRNSQANKIPNCKNISFSREFTTISATQYIGRKFSISNKNTFLNIRRVVGLSDSVKGRGGWITIHRARWGKEAIVETGEYSACITRAQGSKQRKMKIWRGKGCSVMRVYSKFDCYSLTTNRNKGAYLTCMPGF